LATGAPFRGGGSLLFCWSLSKPSVSSRPSWAVASSSHQAAAVFVSHNHALGDRAFEIVAEKIHAVIASAAPLENH
jgi:hypothetical protein